MHQRLSHTVSKFKELDVQLSSLKDNFRESKTLIHMMRRS